MRVCAFANASSERTPHPGLSDVCSTPRVFHPTAHLSPRHCLTSSARRPILNLCACRPQVPVCHLHSPTAAVRTAGLPRVALRPRSKWPRSVPQTELRRRCCDRSSAGCTDSGPCTGSRELVQRMLRSRRFLLLKFALLPVTMLLYWWSCSRCEYNIDVSDSGRVSPQKGGRVKR